jgi:coenzyme F420-reducing hydrogenase alpha subunit
MLRKNIIFPVLGLVLVGSTVAGVGYVSAQDSGGSSSGLNIIQRLAQKFNLNEADVKAVFDEEMQEHHAQMKANLEEKLTQAVKDGKINETQKQAIITKFGEIKVKKIEPGEFKELSKEEIQKMHEQRKTELENWAKENGLTVEALNELIGGGPHKVGAGHKMGNFMFHVAPPTQ